MSLRESTLVSLNKHLKELPEISATKMVMLCGVLQLDHSYVFADTAVTMKQDIFLT